MTIDKPPAAPPVDYELRKIELRHEQDDVWFSRGYHDPNGYIGMAHKDRASLINKLRQLRTGEAQ